MILKVIGYALLLTVAAFLLRRFGWSGAPVFAAICSVMIVGAAADSLRDIFKLATDSAGDSSVSEPIASALKSLGAGYLFGISADVCRELGESGIAKGLEVAGRVEIIAIVIPYFEKIIRLGIELMS